MEPSRRLPFLRAVREIACNEVKRLARDRRALFSAVLLPALIYPLFFHGQAWLKAFSTSSLAERSVTIALDLELAPEPVRQRLPRQLVSGSTVDLVEAGLRPEMASSLQQLRELTLALHEGRPEALDRERELVSRLFESDVDVLVTCQPHPTLSSRRVMQVYHDGADELSNEGLARVERAIVALEDHVRGERIETLLGADDPARGLDLVAVDLASERDTSGAALGSLLPLLALLVIISGGSFAALSVFAGEREAGTLETLLVQPLPAAAVAWGKFYAVLAVSLAALACNVGSLLISLSLGLGALPGLEPGEGQGLVLAVGGGRLLLAGLVFLPTAVMTAALLALISAGARTFREGQHLLLPLTLVAALPAAVAGWTETPLDPLTALAPLLGACLAVREAMRGGLELAPACILLVASTGWAVLAVRALARVLSTERILQGGRIEEESIQNRMQSRTAIGYGLVAVLGSYVVGGWLQSRFGVKGLLLTLWGLLPLLAWLCGRRVARRAGEPLLTSLWLGAPPLRQIAGALLCAPFVAACMRTLVEAQARVAPMPSRMLEAAGAGRLFSEMEQLGPLGLFFLLALSPGVCEELLFRGALLSGLRRDLGTGRILFWQALLFGAAHASVHRFLPTALVGALLAALTLRTRSLLPAIALHVAYDGLVVLGAAVPWTADPALGLLAVPGAYLIWRRGPVGTLPLEPALGR